MPKRFDRGSIYSLSVIPDADQWLERIGPPGADESMTVEPQEHVHDAGDPEQELLPDAGHWVPLTATEAVAQAIRAVPSS